MSCGVGRGRERGAAPRESCVLYTHGGMLSADANRLHGGDGMTDVMIRVIDLDECS